MPWATPINPYHQPVVGWWEDLGLSDVDEFADDE
jgi:hypothetical protein